MTRIAAANTPSDIRSLEASLQEIESALQNSKQGKRKFRANGVSEDALFAALVHKKLGDKYPGLSEKLGSAIERSFERIVRRGKRQALFRSVDNFMRRAIRRGDISRKEKISVMRDAFGKAQLDKEKARLRQRPVSLLEKSELLSQNLAERIGENIKKNSTATRKQIRKFRKWVFEFDPRKAIRSSKEAVVQSEAARSDVVIPSPEANYNDIETGPNDLVYRPVSTNGNAEVFIPLRYTGLIQGVSLESSQGEETLELQHIGLREADGRRVFQADRAGDDFAGPVSIRMRFLEREDVLLELKNWNEFSRIGFNPA